MKMFFLFIICFYSLSAISADVDKVIVLGVHPYLKSTEIIKRFTPLIDFLKEQTKMRFLLRIADNYTEHIQYCGEEKVDLAYIGPTSYVKLMNKYGGKNILGAIQVNKKNFYEGYIFTQKNSSINSIKDLEGKSFAFGDKHSTMSFYLPMYILLQNNITLESFSTYSFLGTHTNVLLGVLIGDFDAGAVMDNDFYDYEQKGLKIIPCETMQSITHLFIAKNSFPEIKLEKLKNAFDSLNVTKNLWILQSIQNSITGLTKVTDEDFKPLEIIMNKVATNEK